MEAMEIIMPTLQDRFDKITASVAHLDPRVGEPWQKLQTLKEYVASIADPQKPRCQECGAHLLREESMICMACGTKTERGSEKPQEIEFASTVAYSRYVETLWAAGKLKNEGDDKPGGGDSQWGPIDGPESRRGSTTTSTSESRRGSPTVGTSSGLESRRGSASDPTPQKGRLLASPDRSDFAGRPSVSSGQPSPLSKWSESVGEAPRKSLGATDHRKSIKESPSGAPNAVTTPPSISRSGSSSEQRRGPHVAAASPLKANQSRGPSEGEGSGAAAAAHESLWSSRVSNAPSDEQSLSTHAAELTGLGDFGEDAQFHSSRSNAAVATDDFMGFDNDDFFVGQPAADSGIGEGYASAEQSILINELGSLDLLQGSGGTTTPSDSDEAGRLVNSLVSQMHDVSFMLADNLVIPSKMRRH